ncbi:sce7726 family protein, partial [uncultured Rheinheimera sp.]|uniref:sce7726 family protein n=1 Tax=uncultured Rheinheimera sp. TaxID=400532 RepID=UPI002598A331
MDKSLATKAFEPEIKAYALEYLRMKGHITKNDVVINEFTIDSYSRRADLVIIRDDYLLAIEIKSEFDSLARLSGQTEKYLEFFDKVLLVTSDSHLEKSIEKVNSNIEILIYS